MLVISPESYYLLGLLYGYKVIADCSGKCYNTGDKKVIGIESMYANEVNLWNVERVHQLESDILILVNKPGTKEAKRIKSNWGVAPAIVEKFEDIREKEGGLTREIVKRYQSHQSLGESVNLDLPEDDGGVSVIVSN